jgi:predicted ATPase/DNA-binding CsgD family transcriptional regulator
MASAAAPRSAAGQHRRGQLPAEVTGFVGRSAEIARLCALLGNARLVTVIGPGGVGKTRICLRAAALAADRYSRGACFVELSGLRDPALLPDTVADCLGLRNPGGLASVLGHLRDRRQLLVLDTCEHIVDGCATFTEALLREAPGVTLLATSRQPLDVPGEHTLLIPPLPVPGPDATPDGNGTGDSVQLFAQRAAAAVPSFRLTDETREDVIRICRRLDGLPLAIELAAVRLRALPLHELADRLEYPFQVLDGGRRGAVPRHQTLHTAIRWSYDLCTPAEQALWARLSVFRGSFDVAAAEDVCARPGAALGAGARYAEVVEPLIGLVDKSVVLRDDNHGARYRLPGMPREFGALRLTAAGETGACRDRHLSYQLAAARRFRDQIFGDGLPGLLRGLRASHDDLCAALEYGLDRCAMDREPGRPKVTSETGRSAADAAELATALQAYWVISGRLREGRYWLGKVIERFAEPSPERALALLRRAYLGAFTGDAADAALDAREGMRIARKLGADELEARGHLYLHAALTFGGRHEEAAAAGAEAERLLTALCDSTGLVLLGIAQAHLLQLAGRPEQAIRQCERTLRRIGDGGERWPHGYLYTIAALARIQVPGQETRCAADAVRGLRAARELGDVIGTAYALEVLAWLAAAAGRPARAAWLTGAADPLWGRTGKRLSGTAIMLEAHRRAAKAALDGLGEERFAVLRARGAACPLQAIVAAAADDADDLDTGLPSLAAGPAAIGQATAGPWLSKLTGREREIAALVASGLSNREVAAKLVISKRTVDAHVEHIFGKLGMSSRVQLTVWLRDQFPDAREPADGQPGP